jgi:DNA-binding LacI/PurR family transcriptional regulator
VPEDLAVAVFDDPDYYTLTTPSITAVASDVDAFARTAVRLLVERLEGGYAGPPRMVTVPAQLIVRESTAGLPQPALTR